MACPHLEEMPITSLLVQSTAKKRKSENKDGEKTKYIIKSESKHKNNTIDNNKFEIALKFLLFSSGLFLTGTCAAIPPIA